MTLSCITVPCETGAPAPRPAPDGPIAALEHVPLDPAQVVVRPEGRTVEASFLLDAYTLLHSRAYRGWELLYPGSDGREVTAHLLLPDGDEALPLVVVFPILEGSHTVSEALAKALVNRGYAVVRLERRGLGLAEADDPSVVEQALQGSVRDARRLLDWAQTHPRIDATRIATAGISLGSMQALLLAAADPRVRGGFFALTGGGLAEILYESTENAVRVFRDRMMEERGLASREAFLEAMRPYTRDVDPLTWANRLEPEDVWMATGRFDRVIPPDRAEALWRALGRPTWARVPSGHYQFFPFFWWMAGRGADHLDALLGTTHR